MAQKVTGQVHGGANKLLENAETVQDVFSSLGLSGNYTVMINGEPAEMDDELEDFSFVSFTQSVKGGQI